MEILKALWSETRCVITVTFGDKNLSEMKTGDRTLGDVMIEQAIDMASRMMDHPKTYGMVQGNRVEFTNDRLARSA